jgi:L-rhamnose mutarotase
VKLKPGSLERYVQWHTEIWAELIDEIERQGIAEITLFEADPLIFLYSQVHDREAWERLWKSEVHARWADEAMKPLMEYRSDGLVDARELGEIWHFGARDPQSLADSAAGPGNGG